MVYKIVSNTQHGIIYEGGTVQNPLNNISQQFFNGVSEVSLYDSPGDRGLRYMPYAYYNGEDSFTFKACDPYGACSNISTVHINVISHDNPTTINDNPILNVVEDDPYNYFQLTGFDPDSSMDFVISNEPQNGSLIRSGGGAMECLDAPIWVDGVFAGNCNPQFVTYQYIPNPNFYGTDSFSFYGVGSSETEIKTVQINVQQFNDPPEAKSFAVSTWEDKAVEIYPMGSDIEGAFETGNLVLNNNFSEWSQNLHFENPPDGTEVADNWIVGASSGMNTTYTISKVNGGIKLIRGPEPETGSSYFHIKQEIPITNGKEYELEFWVYSDWNRVQYQLNYVIELEDGTDTASDIIPNQWNRVIVKGIANTTNDTSPESNAIAFARHYDAPEGTYWIINNISIRETKDLIYEIVEEPLYGTLLDYTTSSAPHWRYTPNQNWFGVDEILRRRERLTSFNPGDNYINSDSIEQRINEFGAPLGWGNNFESRFGEGNWSTSLVDVGEEGLPEIPIDGFTHAVKIETSGEGWG